MSKSRKKAGKVKAAMPDDLGFAVFIIPQHQTYRKPFVAYLPNGRAIYSTKREAEGAQDCDDLRSFVTDVRRVRIVPITPKRSKKHG